MSIDIPKGPAHPNDRERALRAVLVGLTLMLAGRAMTLAYIHRAGGTGPGDPPAAWLLPLLGDAVVGVTAVAIAVVAWRGRGWLAWTSIVVWNAVAAWDALSAFIVHRTSPWPEFFMIEVFGDTMFFMATAMHLVCIVLVTRPALSSGFGVQTGARS